MCDGRPFASPLLRRLAGRGPFPRFPCVHLQPTNAVARVIPCRASSLPPYGFEILTQVQQTNDIDLTCYKTLPTKAVTCSPVEPMFLMLPEAPLEGSDQSGLSPSHEDPNDEHPEDALLASPHLRWRRDALQPPQIQRGSLDRNTYGHVPNDGLRCVTWNTRGLIGSPSSLQFFKERKHNPFSRPTENNNIICLQ